MKGIADISEIIYNALTIKHYHRYGIISLKHIKHKR